MSNPRIISGIQFHEVVRPLRTLFATSLGRKDKIHNVIVKVTLGSGDCGLGEIPTSFILRHETVPVIKKILGEFRRRFKGSVLADYAAQTKEFRREFCAYPMTLSGIEVALFRADIKRRGIFEHEFWGGKFPAIETDITIPFITDERQLKSWIDYALAKKFSIYKVKVSGDADEDKKVLSNVRALLLKGRQEFVLRIDGNQGYNARSFLKFVDWLVKNDYSVQIFEQPLPKNDYKGLKEIKRKSPFPVILDETVFTASDLLRAIEEDICHGVNVKIAKSGIAETKEILQIALRSKLKIMIGCMTETLVGLSAGIFLACGRGVFDFVDLDSVHFLSHNRNFGSIKISGPNFIVSRAND